jgi:hypothetical protein
LRRAKLKIARIPFAAALALLAAPVPAAVAPPKPPAEGGADLARNEWRGRAIGLCVAAMRSPEGVTPDELESICGCGVDRLMAGQATGALPALAPEGVGTELRGPLLACVSDESPAAAAALASRVAGLAQPPQADAEAKPADTALPVSTPAPAEAPKRSAADLGAWLSGWIGESGMPVWAWGALALIAFLLLRGLVRRDARRDLIGPPSSLRPGARPVAPRPRRPDPPQRL